MGYIIVVAQVARDLWLLLIKSANSPRASLEELLPVPYKAPVLHSYVLAQQPKCHTNFQVYSCSYSTYLVCGTMHSWIDATASWQPATILTDADDNFTRQAVDPGIALGPVGI